MAEASGESMDEDINELFRLAAELGVTGMDDFSDVLADPLPNAVLAPPVPLQTTRYRDYSEAEKQELIEQQRKKNTVRSTNSAVNQFYKWMRAMRPSEIRQIHDIPAEELNEYLGSFFAGVRQKDGSEYEPGTITTYQRGIDRYLNEQGYKLSIVRDKEFTSSQKILKAKRSQLRKEGRGNKPNAAEELTEREENRLYESGVIGHHSPEALLFVVWLNNQKHFGFRGCQESRQMTWGDVTLKCTVDGTEYLEFNEKENKTRSSGKVSEQPRAYPPKAFAVSTDLNRCPVYAYKRYKFHRPSTHLASDSAFYLAINYKPDTIIWYKRQPMGVNKLDSLLSTMCKQAGIEGRKTNHSVRRSMIRRLHDSGIPPTKLMQLSGHRNVQSINHYAINSMEDQQRMSELLSGSSSRANQVASTPIQQQSPFKTPEAVATTSQSRVISTSNTVTSFNNSTVVATANADNPVSTATGGVFGGATLNNCTINVKVNVNAETSPYRPPKRRRIAVIYDSSDSSSQSQ
ncbi:uncharacterized protein KIAA1958-like [Glandiceps talaboti]